MTFRISFSEETISKRILIKTEMIQRIDGLDVDTTLWIVDINSSSSVSDNPEAVVRG